MKTRKSILEDIRLCEEQIQVHKGTPLAAYWMDEKARSERELRRLR